MAIAGSSQSAEKVTLHWINWGYQLGARKYSFTEKEWGMEISAKTRFGEWMAIDWLETAYTVYFFVARWIYIWIYHIISHIISNFNTYSFVPPSSINMDASRWAVEHVELTMSPSYPLSWAAIGGNGSVFVPKDPPAADFDSDLGIERRRVWDEIR